MAGIDESNGDGYYILWPKDSQQSANAIREYLVQKFGVRDVGVVITDSTSQPLRRGTCGIALAHSGFAALRDYMDQPDIFGRRMHVTHANITGGVAAAAVLAMGEGNEQTPLALLRDLPVVEFQARNPTADELAMTTLSLEDDLFAPFLTAVDWLPGTDPATDG
jgi:F420-0:gamma-glutamyl ligase